MIKNYNFIFFGTSLFSVHVLDELKSAGFLPSIIVTMPDRPKGRNLKMTAPEAKIWAEKEKIKVLQPGKLDENFVIEITAKKSDFFVVASYGNIISKKILEIPTHGTLNVHPSLLPKLRGATPVQTTILEGIKDTGVTIMQMDEKMDHGSIVAVSKHQIESPDLTEPELEEILAKIGGKLLTEIIPKLISGEIKGMPQDDTLATFTKKIKKEDGEIDLNDSADLNYRKIRAFTGNVGTYFFYQTKDKKIRIKIKSAKITDGKLVLQTVVPENDKEMSHESFLAKYSK